MNNPYAKYLYGALALGVLTFIAVVVTALPDRGTSFGRTVDDMNRDLLEFRTALAVKEDEIQQGKFSAESRADLSMKLATFTKKLGGYSDALGTTWARFIADLRTDVASLKSNLEAWDRTLTESSDTELSAESKARLSTELAIFAGKLGVYESELR